MNLPAVLLRKLILYDQCLFVELMGENPAASPDYLRAIGGGGKQAKN
jgi:hypothetical protein